MQEEIQNNHSDWKKQLDELEAAPSEAAWDKLYSRLENKPRNNKIIWWYVAAACVVLVIFLLTFYNQEKPPAGEFVKNTNGGQSKLTIFQPPAIVKKETSPQKKNVLPHTPKKISITPKEENFPVNIEAPIAIYIPDTSSFAENNISSAAPKKKLRVVHINELQPPAAEETPDLAQNEKTKSRRGKNKNLIHSYVSNSTSDKALKISLSPSN